MMDSPGVISRALAQALVAGPLDVDGLVERGSSLLGRRWRWLRPLAERLCAQFAGRTRPRRIAVARFLAADAGFARACERYELELRAPLAVRPQMGPVAAGAAWTLPPIRTAGELADWLAIGPAELDWFADRRGLQFRQPHERLRHYHFRPLAKRLGQLRLIEAPKPRLKQLQRRILAGILDHVPPHAAAHGFCPGRSIRSFAAPHAGQRVVVRIDLADFFPSIALARVEALFRTAGYPEEVADLLAGLCCNRVPLDFWEQIDAALPARQLQQVRERYARAHLPQGAPTSPALANLCAYRLDCRLTGLAAATGAVYTRYADDLAFSGGEDFSRRVRRFCLHACATALEEGFAVCHRKTRIMHAGVRQHLAGIVVNERPNVRRADFDRLKATLVNCRQHGPAGQNRAGLVNFRAHLLGRISFVEMVHPSRGKRLRRIFEQIDWPEPL